VNTRTAPSPDSTELERIREAIDAVDERLLDLMAHRQRLALSTLDVKMRHGLLPIDVSREAAVVARGAKLARERGLEPELVRDIFWRLIELSRAGYRARGRRNGV
jgi:chorismate mutase